MKWVNIHIEGMVQGVGFRPFVYTLAHALNIKGSVCNGVDGVRIVAGGENVQIEKFQYELLRNAPAESHIVNFTSEEIKSQSAKDFQIVESNSNGQPKLLLTPDFGLCDQCRKEISDPKNRRYNYPFTTCTTCGPRYSIVEALPYDRHVTTMHPFKMCNDCKEEYDDPLNRRYYSQTNSCPACSIPIRLINNDGEELSSTWKEILKLTIQKLEAGEILAVKGIGGYLLMADATNAGTIKKLRSRKHRPTKPFAVMYPTLETLQGDVVLNTTEIKSYSSIQSPIVLARLKQDPASGICVNEIAPNLNRIGVMQPYSALFELLLQSFGKPLIATSGNCSGSPIVFDDQKALLYLKEIADAFLVNDRSIEIAQDDSVIRFTKNEERILIRRSRGFAPTLFNEIVPSEKCMLAMGADLKSSFALQVNNQIYTSQYLGDLVNYESQESFRIALLHLLSLLQAHPEKIIMDAHPNYFSSQLGKEFANQWNIPIRKVQHHRSHAYAVLAENKLLKSTFPILCVVWDGTGYGDDDQIWGGEFFMYEDQQLERVSHFSYTPMWSGDLMARDPRICALFHCAEFLEETQLRKSFTAPEWNYYSKLIETRSLIQTSSVGRLFDAVAGLLGICSKNSFEGEAAMQLETLATEGRNNQQYSPNMIRTEINSADVMKQILRDLNKGISKNIIAYKFHEYLARIIVLQAEKFEIQHIALSGGVFQNGLLIDLIQEKLPHDIQLYLHKELSPNDENIAVGQLASVVVQQTEEHQAISYHHQLN